jgi:hypothetical protein
MFALCSTCRLSQHIVVCICGEIDFRSTTSWRLPLQHRLGGIICDECPCGRTNLGKYEGRAMLQGKYEGPDGGPPGARLNKYRGRYAEAESRYGPKPNSREAVAAYVSLASRLGMSPTELALR